MKRMLHSGALLLLCVLSAGILHAQLKETFTPHPANWILANGYSYHTVNANNDVVVSSNGSSPGIIGTPIVKKSSNTVKVCFNIFGYSSGDSTTLPCASTVDLYFVNSSANNGNDLNNPANVYGTVTGITVPTSGGTICNSFTFPASVTASDFRVFFQVHTTDPNCDMGSVRFGWDNFVISGLTEVCSATCPPVALNDNFNIANPAQTSVNLVLYGPNSAYPAAPAGYLVDQFGMDNSPSFGYGSLTWSLVTPPANGTVTMNPAGQGTATVTRANLSVTTVTFVYQLCDPNGNCDQATVTVNFPAGASLPVALVNFNGNRNGSLVTLKWTTSTESNNAGFQIQRVVNGEYKTLAFLNSRADNGFSNDPIQYQFSEVNNSNSVNWYRLVQINKDGQQKILPSLAVRGIEELQKMLIYPNPGSAVNVLFGASSIRDIVITDLSGKQIKRWNDYHDDNLTINGLQRGMYMLRVIDKKTMGTVVEKIMISK
jgi:hypothetical protein